MSDLSGLYDELVLDHGRAPRNLRAMPEATSQAEGFNPLCGDQIHVYVRMDGETVADVSFTGKGCAISQASASLMTQSLKGKSRAEAEQLFERFHDMIIGKVPVGDGAGLGKLAVFAGVSDYPARVKCAILAWHTLHAALRGGGTISTE